MEISHKLQSFLIHCQSSEGIDVDAPFMKATGITMAFALKFFTNQSERLKGQLDDLNDRKRPLTWCIFFSASEVTTLWCDKNMFIIYYYYKMMLDARPYKK